MTSKFGDDDYLQHIEDAAAKIDRFMVGKSDASFLADDLTQDAIIRNLEIIGEATSKLSAAFRAANTDVPWQKVAGMRNKLIHGYFSVDMPLVLDTVRVMLPDFRARIKAIRRPR